MAGSRPQVSGFVSTGNCRPESGHRISWTEAIARPLNPQTYHEWHCDSRGADGATSLRAN
eukprot:1578893-Alexandrium_andersonii.AAC.1